MDVVSQNIQAIGGSITVDSVEGAGMTITLKIPLTLAIIDGMTIRVGSSRYTMPTISIVESFRPKEKDIIRDPEDREMIMVRGQCYPIIRLHRLYNVQSDTERFTEGILIMAQHDDQTFCLFADELIGQQQVVGRVPAAPGRRCADGLENRGRAGRPDVFPGGVGPAERAAARRGQR